MNGHSPINFAADTYLDTSGEFYYGDDLKLPQLPKQHFVPTAGPFLQSAQDLATFNDAQGLADLEKLSSEYTPEYTGQLVGELESCRDIAMEYAGADPIYVAKTSALYPTYTHYRKIRGDGNCAWRAIAFGYFELLLRNGNADLIDREWARLASLQNLLKAAGFSELVYVDFAAETLNVFQVISNYTLNDVSELVTLFNKSSDSIVGYLKMLTNAWMKTRPTDYESYLETTLSQYCSMVIDPFNAELDDVGLKALIDCLVIPADFRVEISYLDRSAGNEVNVHSFESGENPYAPTLRLLYRPGHYDIIYKMGDIASLEKPSTSPVQVSFMPDLPDQYFASTPLNYFLNSSNTTTTNTPSRNDDRDRFRASLFQYPPFQPSPLPFQTSIFRNSAYNPSHYQSENFQPELYQPELANVSEGRGRRRS